MRFGRIYSTIWMDARFCRLDDQDKLLFLYLLSSDRCNSIGLFPLGLGAMEDEYGQDRRSIMLGLAHIEAVGLILYDNGWLCFNKFLKWNPPSSPNHAKKCAVDLNYMMKAGAPKDFVCSFLSVVRPILSSIQSKDKESYWDAFKITLDMNQAVEVVGGKSVLLDCFEGKYKRKREGSTGEVLPKYCQSTSENREKDDFDPSTCQVLPKTLARNKNKNKTKNKTITKQAGKETERFSFPTCNNKSTENEISNLSVFDVLCKDGTTGNVSSDAIELIAETFPEIDLTKAKMLAQKRTLLKDGPLPANCSKCDSWFLDLCEANRAVLGGAT